MVVIICKKDSALLKNIYAIMNGQHEDRAWFYDIRFVSAVEDLEAMISEFTTAEHQAPLLIFTGKYLYRYEKKGNCREAVETDDVIYSLKKRKHCIVVVWTCLAARSNLADLVVSTGDMDIFEVFALLQNRDLAGIVEKKDLSRFRSCVKKIFDEKGCGKNNSMMP